MVFSFSKPIENLTESVLCRWGMEKPGINIVKKSGSLSAAALLENSVTTADGPAEQSFMPVYDF